MKVKYDAPGSEVEKLFVHARKSFYITDPPKHEKEAIYEVNQRIPNVAELRERRSCGAILGYQKKKESSNIVRAGTSFCSTVESMKQISENYLNNEKGYVNDWAVYISSVGMTREEAIEYISKTNTQPERQEAALCQSLKRT